MSCLGVSDDGISLCTGSWDSLVCFICTDVDYWLLTRLSAENMGVVITTTWSMDLEDNPLVQGEYRYSTLSIVVSVGRQV